MLHNDAAAKTADSSPAYRGGSLLRCRRDKDGTRPEKFRFIERDYLQAEWADYIIVVECCENGGTMHTVKDAHMLGVPIAAIRSEASGNKIIIEEYGGTEISNFNELDQFLTQNKKT